MAGIIVEDGAGLPNAETFISVEDADAYHAGRANAAWAALATEAEKEAFLRRATDYMQAVYKLRWKGVPVTTLQALDWPRAYVEREYSYTTVGTPPSSIDGNLWWPSNEVPVSVQRACAELALRAIDGDLLADLEPPVIEETVGPITTRYAEGTRQTKTYPQIDAMLAPLLQGSSGSLKVVRA